MIVMKKIYTYATLALLTPVLNSIADNAFLVCRLFN
jgi:hypothetical protein